MPPESADHRAASRTPSSARTHLLAAFGAAVVAGGAAGSLGAGRAAVLIGWDVLALVFCGWVWSIVWGLDADTATHANREDPGRDLTDLVLLGAAVASLIAVGVVLFGAGPETGTRSTCRPLSRWRRFSCRGP